ncbi:hypothetical protein [Verminephrobacter aporrectodeae]|nr:hypothetical protein [Verminephrobacter aporrectodeae]
MKKIIYWSCGVALMCIAGAVWSISWIDGVSVSDSNFPGKYQLAAARLFWSMTPAIDRNVDAEGPSANRDVAHIPGTSPSRNSWWGNPTDGWLA